MTHWMNSRGIACDAAKGKSKVLKSTTATKLTGSGRVTCPACCEALHEWHRRPQNQALEQPGVVLK